MQEEKKDQQNNSFEVPEIVVEQLRQSAKEQVKLAQHEWRQKGAWIKCHKCGYPHAMRVRSDVRLIGIDENSMPVFGTSR